MNYDCDLFVIGAGSGGVRAARISARYGAKVAVAEDLYLGGTCVNVGCVPKKLFVYASEFAREFHHARGFGWNSGPASFDWATLRDNKTAEVERLNGIYGSLLDNAGVELIEGRAEVVGPNQVKVGSREYTAKYILIAAGSWPFIPDIPGKKFAISSNEAFYLENFPKRVAVVGGGYIAVEFAGIFHGLQAETHLVYRGPLFLKKFDQDLRTNLTKQMTEDGINFHLETDIAAIEKQPDGSLLLSLNNGENLEVDCVMYATGRKPKTDGLGLENTRVTLNEKGAIKVNSGFQTDEPSIYALGDVIGRVELTPVAITEAMALANNLFNNGNEQVDYNNIPTAVFSQPNIGTVGLTEEKARGKYQKITVYKSDFKPMKQTLGGGAERIFMKLIVDADTDKVVGCHMLGEHAGEIIQGIGIAIKAGATKADFDSTIGIHPTVAEELVTMRVAEPE